MNKFLEKIKNGNQKRLVENTVIFLALLVILMIVINSFEDNSEKNEIMETATIIESNKTDDLEEKLEKILSAIEGVGKTNVMISYSSTISEVPLYDTKENITVTEEKDKEGGTRKTEQTSKEKNVIFEESNSTKSIAIKEKEMPKIIGVIVVAEGANNVKTKENIINAVSAVIDVASHRIQVFSKQK